MKRSRIAVIIAVFFLLLLLLSCEEPPPANPQPTSERPCAFYGHPPKPICNVR